MRIRTCTMSQMQSHLDEMLPDEYWNPPEDDDEEEVNDDE